MRVFSMRSKVVDGRPSVTDVNCSLSIDEIRMIKMQMSKTKPCENEVLESVRFGLIQTLSDYE